MREGHAGEMDLRIGGSNKINLSNQILLAAPRKMMRRLTVFDKFGIEVKEQVIMGAICAHVACADTQFTAIILDKKEAQFDSTCPFAYRPFHFSKSLMK